MLGLECVDGAQWRQLGHAPGVLKLDAVLRRECLHQRRGTGGAQPVAHGARSEEPTSELQSLMRISYAVFCLKKTKYTNSSHNYMQTPQEQFKSYRERTHEHATQ